MPGISFTEEDFKAKHQIEPAWYEADIKSVTEKPGKTDSDTITYHVEFLIKEGAAENVTARAFFNNAVQSQMGDLLNLFKCFTDVQKGKTYEPSELVGRHVRVFAYYNMDMTMNMVKDFRPSTKKVA